MGFAIHGENSLSDLLWHITPCTPPEHNHSCVYRSNSYKQSSMGSCDRHVLTIPGCNGRVLCLHSSGPEHWPACPANSPRTMKDPTMTHISKTSAFGVKCLLSGFKYLLFTQGISMSMVHHPSAALGRLPEAQANTALAYNHVPLESTGHHVRPQLPWWHQCEEQLNMCSAGHEHTIFRIQSRNNGTFDMSWWLQICQHNESLYEHVMVHFINGWLCHKWQPFMDQVKAQVKAILSVSHDLYV